MQLLGYAVCGAMVTDVLVIAPLQSSLIKICDVEEYPVCQEVPFDKLYEALYFSFCKRMSGLAQLCLKAYGFHEGLIILLPDGMAFQISSDDYALHVVSQYIPRNAHILKRMNHADEKIFLLGVWEKFYISLTAVMANHGKASSLKLSAAVIQDFRKAPVHLEGFSRICCITLATAYLRCVGGKMNLPPHGKENFARHGKEFFTWRGKEFFTS